MAKYRLLLVLIVLLHYDGCQGSLLKDTLTKAANSHEEVDDVNVEIASEEKKVKESSEDEMESTKADQGHKNVTIKMETLYRPTECTNVTKTGNVAVIHYTGWINGKKFDSTVDPLKRYAPFEFLVGTGAVIKGFEQGIKEMCKGERRKIVIPPELGYGTKGAGLIPGNATITYDVQLLDLREPPPQADVFGAMDGNGDKKLSRDEVNEYMKKQSQMHYGAPMDDERWNNYHDHMVDNIFEQEDVDEDGHISHDEFSGPKLFHEEL